MIQQKCLSDSDIENYADVENLYRAPIFANKKAPYIAKYTAP
jgi:hypothetical protein